MLKIEDTVFSLRGPLSATSKQYPPWYPPDKSEEHRYKSYKIPKRRTKTGRNCMEVRLQMLEISLFGSPVECESLNGSKGLQGLQTSKIVKA